jgi:DNA modification methylase
MTPYYEDDACTIYHGDCREILPTLTRVDCVLTDPPYGVGLDYDEWDDTPSALDDLIPAVHPLMMEAAETVAITSGIVNIHRWPPSTWVLAWTWPHTGSTGKWGFNQWGPVLVYGTDPYLSAGKGRHPDVIQCGANDYAASGHPCPKPQQAWARILQRVSPFGESVLDPFMGSGTTLRVAKDHGRKAIGIELSERYCEIAARRLGQEVLL